MDSTSYFCQTSGCINPAIAFFFKANRHFRVCSDHTSSSPSELFPISHLTLLASPLDLNLYYTRKQQYQQGMQYLQTLLAAVNSEWQTAEVALEQQREMAIKAVNDSYDAEVRRAKQHFRQAEAAINEHIQTFENFMLSKSIQLTDLEEKMTVSGQIVPRLLRFRAYSIEYDIVDLVARSCSRGELPFDKHLALVLISVGRAFAGKQLLRQAGEAQYTDDFVEMQKAVANCAESLEFLEEGSARNEAISLTADLEARMEQLTAARRADAIEKRTKDAASIKYLLDLYTESMEEYKSKEDKVTIERMLLQLNEILLPLSQSKETADFIRSTMDFLLTCSEYDFESANCWYQESLSILSTNFSETESIVWAYLSVSRIQLADPQNHDIESLVRMSLSIAEKLNPDSKCTACCYLMLGRVCQANNKKGMALSAFRSSRKLFTQHCEICIELAHVYLYSGELILSLIEDDEDIPEDYRSDEDDSFDKNGDDEARIRFQKAIEIYNTIAPECNEVAKAYYRLSCCFQKHKIQECESCLLTAVRLFEKRYWNQVNLADAYRAAGEFYFFPTFFWSQRELDDKNMQKFANLPKKKIMNCSQYGMLPYNIEKVEEYFKAALAIYCARRDHYPKVVDIYEKLTIIQLQKLDLKESETFLTTLLATDYFDSEKKIDLCYRLIAVYIAEDNLIDAESLILANLADYSLSPLQQAALKNDLSCLYYSAGKYDNALALLLSAVEIVSTKRASAREANFVFFNLALMYQRSERKSDAQRIIYTMFQRRKASNIGTDWLEKDKDLLLNIPYAFKCASKKHNMLCALKMYLTTRAEEIDTMEELSAVFSYLMASCGNKIQPPECDEVCIGCLQEACSFCSSCLSQSFDCALLLIQFEDFEFARKFVISALNHRHHSSDVIFALAYTSMLFHLRKMDKASRSLLLFSSLFEEFIPDRSYASRIIDMLSYLAQLSHEQVLCMPYEPLLEMEQPLLSHIVRITLLRIDPKKSIVSLAEELAATVQTYMRENPL